MAPDTPESVDQDRITTTAAHLRDSYPDLNLVIADRLRAAAIDAEIAKIAKMTETPAATVTIPEDVYDALLRLAAVHKRQFCDCENCTPEKAFPDDDCGCGHDWTTCNEDVYVVDAYVPNWRDQP